MKLNDIFLHDMIMSHLLLLLFYLDISSIHTITP